MPRSKVSAKGIAVACQPDSSAQGEIDPPNRFDPGLPAALGDVACSGLTPSSALDLLTRLIAEVPSASKERMEQIKMMDKLLNTARAMMETRLKNEEAVAIAGKLEEMEVLLERLAAEKALENRRPMEVWNDARLD